MKLSPAQQVIFVAAMIMQMLVVFHVPIGISDSTADVLLIMALVCLGIVFVLWRRRKTAGIPEAPSLRSPPKSRKILMIVMIALASLSGPFWLPYTGATLPFRQLVVISLVTCALCVSICLIVWHRLQARSNQSLQSTAGRSDQ